VVTTVLPAEGEGRRDDETEGDFRAVLNFGHTIGHAVETLRSTGASCHGEAVAIGMVLRGAPFASEDLAREPRWARLEALLAKLGLPTRVRASSQSDQLALTIEPTRRPPAAKIKFVVPLRDRPHAIRGAVGRRDRELRQIRAAARRSSRRPARARRSDSRRPSGLGSGVVTVLGVGS